MAVHAEALAGGAEPGEQNNGEGIEQQQPVAPLRVADARPGRAETGKLKIELPREDRPMSSTGEQSGLEALISV
jgi:hypothetical protein